MTIFINVLDVDRDLTLFGYMSPSVPSVGEFIEYDFSANDQPEWAPESWEHHMSLKNTTWRVVEVRHLVRRNHIAADGSRYRAVVHVRRAER